MFLPKLTSRYSSANLDSLRLVAKIDFSPLVASCSFDLQSPQHDINVAIMHTALTRSKHVQAFCFFLQQFLLFYSKLSCLKRLQKYSGSVRCHLLRDF